MKAIDFFYDLYAELRASGVQPRCQRHFDGVRLLWLKEHKTQERAH